MAKRKVVKMSDKKSILITGGAGFIGSNFIPYFFAKYPNYRVINIDKLTYAGDLGNLAETNENSQYRFIHGDICNKELVAFIFREYDIRGVIHFAAESHVDNSINFPDEFIKTNINGTQVLLDVARTHWMIGPKKTKPNYEGCRLHHISTDEVYGSLGGSGYFTEDTPYRPNSPYSASKAGADLLVRSYFHTYGMNVVTTNCSNNYGPKQHSEKLIPTIIRKALLHEPIPIYGNGKNVRDWLYVLDHCRAIDLVFHNAAPGETYNIGGGTEKTNLEVAQTICQILDRLNPRDGTSYKKLITFVTDRLGHDWRYAIDATKMHKQFCWQPTVNIETGLKLTVQWYLDNRKLC